MTNAADQWRDALAAWAIPEGIITQAEESPWIHPPVLFQLPALIEPSPSHDRAREVLADHGSVLDVGCGGGIAAFALTPPATRVIGVDHQAEMLEMFQENARARSLECEVIEGFWPGIEGRTPIADVATAHHVVYNVGDITPFLRAMNDHARRRVVLEMPNHHPLSAMSDAWAHFWRLERPVGPTPLDLMAVLEEMSIHAQCQEWSGTVRAERDLAQAAHFMRIRLCLPASRESEVYDYLAQTPVAPTRALTTIWWDTTH